jgi:protein translocase SecG subunit
MHFIVGVLTFLLVINCFVLTLLVLVQLPKKDAGAGIAFGGGTADALFGAGSGNALTKITKYATVALLVLSLFIGYLQDRVFHAGNAATFEKMVEQQQMQKPIAPAASQPVTPSPSPKTTPALSVPLTTPTTTSTPSAK